MANRIKKCRVCGADYEACQTLSAPGVSFRWQEVACSPECGETYLQLVMEARSPVKEVAPVKKRKCAVVDEPHIEPLMVDAADDENIAEEV